MAERDMPGRRIPPSREFPEGFAVPDGYRVELTDEPVEGGDITEIGRRVFRWRAERLRQKYPPLIPTYHTRVEKVGFLLWAVVPYQNRLVPVEQGEPINRSDSALGFRSGESPEGG